MHTHPFKTTLIFALSFLSTALCAYEGELQHAYNNDLPAYGEEQVKTTVKVCGVITCIWATGATYRICIKQSAETRFAQYRELLTRFDGNDQECWQHIKQLLKRDHAAAYDSWITRTFLLSNSYKNYPYVLFKKDLDWYISRLSFSRIFYVGITRHEELTKLIADLKKIRRLVMTSDTYIKEQRHFEERREDKALLLN